MSGGAMSQLINNWNNNIDNYAGAQLNAGKPHILSTVSWNMPQPAFTTVLEHLEIGNWKCDL